jgi:hypothetical protein
VLNFQEELPNIPVEGFSIRFKVGEKGVEGVTRVRDKQAIDYTVRDGVLRFTCPRVETFDMFVVRYKSK